MRKITLYSCEICGHQYDNPEEALSCEAKVLRDPFPVGMIYGNASDKENFYSNITFAIARDEVYKTNPHLRLINLWACRDRKPAGDSIGEEVCGAHFGLNLDESDAPDPNHPTFERMVAFLQTTKHKITVWNGWTIVSLRTFLRERKGK